MRKLKVKNDKLKAKHIVNILNENKEYYLLLRCLCELPTMIKLVFKVSSNDLKKYINEKVKIKYNSELVKECWYPGLTEALNRWLRLCNNIKVPKEDIEFVQNKQVTDFFVQNVGGTICDFQILLNEKIKEDSLRDVIMLLATLRVLITCTRKRENLIDKLEAKSIKYLKCLVTTYRETFGAMLYDMQNYTGYCYKKKA